MIFYQVDLYLYFYAALFFDPAQKRSKINYLRKKSIFIG